MKTTHRSGARDLPPAADAIGSEVLIQSASFPRAGDIITIFAPCGINIRVRVDEITQSCDGWMGWATQIDDLSRELRARGVPVDRNSRIRIFKHQVVNK